MGSLCFGIAAGFSSFVFCQWVEPVVVWCLVMVCVLVCTCSWEFCGLIDAGFGCYNCVICFQELSLCFIACIY